MTGSVAGKDFLIFPPYKGTQRRFAASALSRRRGLG